MMGIVASVLGWVVGFVAMVLIAGSTKGWDMVGEHRGARRCLDDIRDGRSASGCSLTMVATIAPAHARGGDACGYGAAFRNIDALPLRRGLWMR